jgi:large subunit ribosomal protein L23
VNRDPRDIIVRPVVSEKSYASFDNNVYTFIVAPDANKIEIRKAVEQLFARRVEKVHTINRKAKRSRNRSTGAYNAPARQKRAIVTLAAGEERIDIFGS